MRREFFKSSAATTVAGFGKAVMLCVATAFILTLASCGDKGDEASPRDKFIGSYTYVDEGNLILNFGGSIFEFPESTSGIFTIAPSGDPQKVILRMPDGETHEYLVSGNSLSATYQKNETTDGLDFQYTIISNGTLTGTTLTFLMTASGVTVVEGLAGTISGNETIIAHKQ